MYRFTKLENGVRVLTEHCPGTRSVSIGALVDAGPQDDPENRLGLAHLTEHALFQGTSARSEMEIARLMDAAGGQMGAFTTRDYTCYFANVLDDYVTFAIDLLGDILCNSTFPAEQMSHEQQAIIREIGIGIDSPTDRVHNSLKRAIWHDHPLGRLVHGDAEHVARTTREDIIYFLHEHYTPDRVIVCAAGNVDHDLFVEHVQDALWMMDGQNPRKTTTPCQFHRAVTIEPAPVSQAYYAVAIPCPRYVSDDRYKWFVLNTILGGGMSSRLFRKIREEMGRAYHIDSAINAYRDAGILIIEGSTSPDSLHDVLRATLLEMGKLAFGDQPIDEEELWTARMHLRGQHLLSGENLSTRMSRMATQEFYFGRRIEEQEILKSIENVSLEDLQELVEQTLTSSLSQIGVAVTGGVESKTETEAVIQEISDCFRYLETSP